MASQRRSFAEWQSAWNEATKFKSPARRREALEPVLHAPLRVVLKVAGAGRRQVSRSLKVPKVDHSARYFFAGTRRKGVLRDAVEIAVWRTRRKVRIEQILICHEIRLARTPTDYLISESVLAAAGTVDGCRIVNTYEYLAGADSAMFLGDVEQELPRLKEYGFRGGAVTCIWSTRAFDLPNWRRRLQSPDDVQLEFALKELAERMWSVCMSDDTAEEIRKALNPLLENCCRRPSPLPELAQTAWTEIGNRTPIDSSSRVQWQNSPRSICLRCRRVTMARIFRAPRARRPCDAG